MAGLGRINVKRAPQDEVLAFMVQDHVPDDFVVGDRPPLRADRATLVARRPIVWLVAGTDRGAAGFRRRRSGLSGGI
jgi:hypothetical protein